MQWKDNGIVVNIKHYGDARVILCVFTRNHGVYNGLLRISKKKQQLQVGDIVLVTWRARLANNLGHFTTCEVISSTFYHYFQDRIKLLCLSSVTSTICKAIPVSDAHPLLYDHLVEFTKAAESNGQWYNAYVKLELEMLAQLGFALDLSKCAVYNTTNNLLFISPKTGKAISETAGAEFRHLLFPLPKTLLSLYWDECPSECSKREFATCLRILGFFVHRHLLSGDENFFEQRKVLISSLFC